MPSLTDVFKAVITPPREEKQGVLESMFNSLISNAEAQEKPRLSTTTRRYNIRNGQIYALGVPISREEAIATMKRAQESMLRNDQMLNSSHNELRPVVSRAHALAKEKLSKDISELMDVLNQ